jgi:hypothetical protein
MMMWSTNSMSRIRPAAKSCFVALMSSGWGVGSTVIVVAEDEPLEVADIGSAEDRTVDGAPIAAIDT